MARALLCAGVVLALGITQPSARVSGASATSTRASAQAPAIVDVVLSVTNRESAARTAEPVTSGVPFAQGVVSDSARLRILQDGREVPAQFLVTARWPDDSIRWVLVDFQTDLPAAGTRALTLQAGTAQQAISGITVSDEPGTLIVNTRARTFTFTKSTFQVRDLAFLVRHLGATYRATPTTWTVEEQGPMKAVVRVDGGWRDDSRVLVNEFIRFRARLVFFRDKSDVRVSLTVRNNNSFGWSTAGEGDGRQEDLVIDGVTFGQAALLPDGGGYHLGSGVEKTWDVDVTEEGTAAVRRTRFDLDGNVVGGDAAPRPLAAAAPAYYAGTRGWGRIGLPVTGLSDGIRQADFDRFERIQRAKVDRTAVEDPPGLTGTTVWGHLSRDLDSWNDYGDLRWDGNGCGTLSGNHYDWGFGMFLQFMRTGTPAFADAARVMTRHEIDFDVYHTDRDSTAFNYQKNWEDRPSHNNPDNCFGGGRPSHTWSQGYALLWLLTGDHRGKDAFDEIQEGVRQYIYESFNGEGRIDTSEIRIHGWLLENLVNRWRLEPNATLATRDYGIKPLRVAMQDVLRVVFEREAAAGRSGFVITDEEGDGHLREPLMNAYFLEPAIKAHDEVFSGRDAEYAEALLGLVTRMTNWLVSITYGGDRNGEGAYRPRQIPYWFDTRLSQQADGQVPYLLMAANAAGYLYTTTGEPSWLEYGRLAFQDYVRYVGVMGPDSYGDAEQRTPAAYNSSIYTGTESKIQGWSIRYGQYFLAAEAPTTSPQRR